MRAQWMMGIRTAAYEFVVGVRDPPPSSARHSCGRVVWCARIVRRRHGVVCPPWAQQLMAVEGRLRELQSALLPDAEQKADDAPAERRPIDLKAIVSQALALKEQHHRSTKSATREAAVRPRAHCLRVSAL